MADERVGVVLGATGLVGGDLLDRLLGDPAWRVVAVGRRETGRSHPRLTQRVVPLDHLGSSAEVFRGAAAVFCCLGTTLRKAGSQEAFAKVDLDAVAHAARASAAAGVPHFLLVTASGANERSRVFYNRVKGQAERAGVESGVPRVTVFRPSLLLGPRDERRPLEAGAQRLGAILAPLMVGPLRRVRPIPSWMVAAAMLRLADRGGAATRIVENEEISSRARGQRDA